MNPHIFRQYDVRGLVDEDLTEEVVTNLGRAYGTFLQRLGLKNVVLGRDVRLSSTRLRDDLMEGILSTGCTVIDIGVVPTPVLYFSIVHLEKDGGVMITGSHNPIEYNGFKMCRGVLSIYGDDIQQLRGIIESGRFTSGKGQQDVYDIVPEYIRNIEGKIKIERPIKMVIDAGNGTAGEIAPRIFEDLGCHVVKLYCEPDGRFPNHLPDPTVPEYLKDLISKVHQEEADIGIGYDGDADRLGAVDEKGEIVWGDKLLALYARDILRNEKGSKIVFDVKCSQGLVDDITANGGVPVMWKTGHSLLKAKMKEEGAPVGGEMSGHMFFGDNYGYDDAIYASARLVRILSESNRPFSVMTADIPRYYSTPEIRVECSEDKKFEIVDDVKNYFKKTYETIDIDGVRILFKDGWGLVRASNTQPILVMRCEAGTEERLLEIEKIIIDKLREYPSVKV
ncbi:MAG: phosphomannomutase/phosphoglucomutase [Gemmatimonadota bacterium]|nr:MAG: phosphomannomutase/phosphoglucomutase [Gemmatimonadota bacterium]